MEKAAKPIRERDYPAEAKAMGAEQVDAFAVDFDGEDVNVLGVDGG